MIIFLSLKMITGVTSKTYTINTLDKKKNVFVFIIYIITNRVIFLIYIFS